MRSQRIGFVFQSFHLLPYRTVLENVMLAEIYRRRARSIGRRERALAAIERVGLAHRVDFLPIKLSGGERQRVAIARALVGSQLAAVRRADRESGFGRLGELLDLFEKLNREGLTLAVVTHDETSPAAHSAACTSSMAG